MRERNLAPCLLHGNVLSNHEPAVKLILVEQSRHGEGIEALYSLSAGKRSHWEKHSAQPDIMGL